MKKTIQIIGSGFSSLSAACYLAQAGHTVCLYEKNSTVGGRARQLKKEGFTFDIGPSWYWMPDVFDRFFARHGKKTSNYFKLNKLDPGFSIVFDKNDELVVPASFDELVNTFESIEKGGGEQLRKFMKKAKKKYEIGMADLVYKPSHSIFEFINFSVIKGLFHLSIFTSFSKYVRRYFTDSRLVKLMEFPVLFLGATPKNTPALYSLMNYTGLEVGTYYPDGGFFAVIQSFVDLAKEKNVKIILIDIDHFYTIEKEIIDNISKKSVFKYKTKEKAQYKKLLEF